jgi:hypothetical protein
MSKRMKQFFRSPGWYFLLAVFFALLSVLATKRFRLGVPLKMVTVTMSLQWIFWSLIFASLVCLVALINSILLRFHERGQLPKQIAGFYEESFKRRVSNVFERLKSVTTSFIGQMSMFGFGIVALVAILSSSGAIDDSFVDSSLYRLAAAMRAVETRGLRYSLFKNTLYYGSPVGDASGKKYIERYKTTIQRLENAGAKAILVDLRSCKEDPFDLMRELQEFRTVVFGMEYGTNYQVADSLHKYKTSKAMFTLISGYNDYERAVAIDRLQPICSIMKDEEVHDVTIELLRKYHDYPGDLQLKRQGDVLVFGDYSIPITPEGWMYFRAPFLYSLEGHSFPDRRKPGTLSQTYASQAVNDSVWEADLKASFQEPHYEGKIVLLSEVDSHESVLLNLRYCFVLGTLLQKDFLTKSGTGSLWLSLLCVVAGGVLVYSFRPLLAILLMLVVAICALFFCSYLYESHNFLIDVFYPLLSIALAMIAFPTIALVQRQEEKSDRNRTGRRVVLVLGAIVVGITLNVALDRATTNRIADCRAEVIDGLNDLSINAHAYYKRPASEGGGGGKFSALTIERISRSIIDLRHRYYVESRGDDYVVILGVGNVLNGPDSVRVRIKITENRNYLEIIN